jgi:hypothetical protein
MRFSVFPMMAASLDGGVNQDSHVLFEGQLQPFGTVVLAAVFDGHSPGWYHPHYGCPSLHLVIMFAKAASLLPKLQHTS